MSKAPKLRVVELASWLAAPGAGALLADFGAEVIKVEPPAGDPGRHFISVMGGEVDTTPSFSLLNRGKKSVVIDLAQESGRKQFQKLLAGADVFITNLRQGSLARLGLDPEAVLPKHPRLVYASVTGMGLRGTESDTPVYDVGGFWARSGLMHQLTAPDASPPSPTGGFGDIVTSLALYAAIVTALLQRERTGKGGLVETSLLQTGAFVVGGDLAVQAAHGHVAGQAPRRQSRTPMVNCYMSSDGRWFFLTGIEARRHFPKLCRAIERGDLIADARFANARDIRKNSQALVAILDEAFSHRTLHEWAQRFAEEDVWWQPVATPAEVLKDKQVTVNDMLHAVWDGEKKQMMVTTPFTVSRRHNEAARAPSLGEHTEAILREIDS